MSPKNSLQTRLPDLPIFPPDGTLPLSTFFKNKRDDLSSSLAGGLCLRKDLLSFSRLKHGFMGWLACGERSFIEGQLRDAYPTSLKQRGNFIAFSFQP